MEHAEKETPLRERCRSLRLDTGYSMEDLASLCRISAGTISNFESGKSSPTVGTLEAYLGAMGYRIEIRRAAMKPVRKLRRTVQYADVYECPSCGKPFSNTGVCYYCCRCGQEIDWKEYGSDGS